MGLTVGTPGGNKELAELWVGTPGGNKQVQEGWVGTPDGNKQFFSGLGAEASGGGSWSEVEGGYQASVGCSGVGGTAPYSYSWNAITGQGPDDPNSSGSLVSWTADDDPPHTELVCTVTDAHGLTADSGVVVIDGIA